MNDSNSELPENPLVSYVLTPVQRGDTRHSRLFAILWGNKRKLIIASIAGFVLTYVMTFLINPVYRAETVIAPATLESDSALMAGLQSQLGTLASLAGIGIGDAERDTQKALARMHSREFLYRFIEDEGLIDTLFSRRGILAAFDHESPKLEDAYRKFKNEILFIAEDRRTGLVTVSIDWVDPDRSAYWANMIVKRLNEDLRATAIEEASANIAFLQNQAEKVETVGLRELVYRLLEAQMNESMLAEVREEYMFMIIDPAYVPDSEGIVRPRRFVLAMLGGIISLLVVFAFLAAYRGRPERSQPAT